MRRLVPRSLVFTPDLPATSDATRPPHLHISEENTVAIIMILGDCGPVGRRDFELGAHLGSMVAF